MNSEFRFVSGSCPLCEKDLTIGMKSIIRSIKFSNFRASSSTDELVSYKIIFVVTLCNFLNRARAEAVNVYC